MIRRNPIILRLSAAPQEKAEELQSLLTAYEIDAKIVMRKKHYVVYVKEGSQIVELLGLTGAHVSLMQLENVRIVKEMRNSVNRKVNCETANLNKTVSAAVRQVEDIRYIQRTIGFQELNEGLAEMAVLRAGTSGSQFKGAWGFADAIRWKIGSESPSSETESDCGKTARR